MLSPFDARFGPQLPGQFDFTICFEHVIFKIVPGVLAIGTIPVYVNIVLREKRRVRPGFILSSKAIVGSTLVGLCTASLATWQSSSLLQSGITVAATAVTFAASLGILSILYVAHSYSLQPSSFLSVFLAITALLDGAVARSYFRRGGMDGLAALEIAMAVVKFILVILEEFSKRSLFYSAELRSSTSTETVAGFWNRATFGWFNCLMLFAFRNTLTLDGLPKIDEAFDSAPLYNRFLPVWDRADKHSKFGLLAALASTLCWEAFEAVPPRLLFTGFIFSQPFLLFRTAAAVEDGTSRDIAHALIGATALVFLGVAVTRALYQHASYRVLTSVRGILTAAIYGKMQKLPKDKLDQSAAATLVTADVIAVEQMVSLFYEVWSSTILVGLGTWALYLFVGAACFLMLVPSALSVVASHYLGNSMSKARKAWNEQIELRVAATSTVLEQIKGVKSMGLSGVLLEYLQDKRRTEIKTSLQDRHTRIMMVGLGALTWSLTPVIVIAAAYFWTRAVNPLSAAEVFTVIAIINVTSEPFSFLLESFVQWSGGLASLQRIQQFLCLDEVADYREVILPPPENEPIVDVEKKAECAATQTPASIAVSFSSVDISSGVGAILRAASFEIPAGSLAIFWGSVSSGKSTLLQCIVGEMPVTSGVVSVATKCIAYCSQESWLSNGTLRQSVIGVLKFVEAWYREVIAACGLDVDILALTNGDQFSIGTGGCNLSGGQKQRVSLARAVYEQASIMVVDDVLSGLDPATAQHVFTTLFGKDGIVRRWNCTVVMTTNQLHFLDGADLSFHILKGGCVVQEGRKPPASSAGSASDTLPMSASKTPAAALDTFEPPILVEVGATPPVQDKRKEEKYGDWSLYAYFLGSAGVGTVALWLCASAASSTLQSMPSIFLRIWYGIDPTNQNFFFGYVAVSVGNVIFNILTGAQFFYQVTPKSSEEMHRLLAETALFATWQYLSHTDSGELLNRFTQDMALTSQALPIAFLQFVHIFFSVLVEVGVIASGSRYVAPIIVLILAILLLIQAFYLRTARQLRLLELESSSAILTHFSETSAGIHHIRSFGWQQQFADKLYDVLRLSQKPYYLLFCCRRWLTVSLDYTSAGAAVALVAFSVTLSHVTSGAAVGLALLSLIGFSDVASSLIRAWTNLETSLGSVLRIKDFCLTTPQESDAVAAVPVNWPSAGRLDFKDVSAIYGDEFGNSHKALDNISFTIYAGERVGVSGRTGSGKSSLFMTILRMIEFTGNVSIDGYDTKNVPRQLLRERITTLTQDGVELRGSIRFNLFPFVGPKPDDELITSTLQSVGLWEHIECHGGLDSNIAEMRFSASQKQLLFLARGILHHKEAKTKIVLMDEATSAMDHDATADLRVLLDATFADCTVLQIAHREDAFRHVDVAVRLHSGGLESVVRKQAGSTM